MRFIGPSLLTAVLLVSAMAGVARAQTLRTMPAADDHGVYAQVLVDAAFGNVSSQSYGGEVGMTVWPNVQIFIEGGRVNNVASSSFFDAAQAIAGSLSQTQSGVGFSAKEPVAFGDAGLRYIVPIADSSVQPYVMAGFGIARVTQNAKFTVNGTDVTGNLAQYGIVLGTDLSGAFTKPLLTLGVGVSLPVWERVAVDLHYRYGRVFVSDSGINVSRAGVGLGVRF
jgi:opacity protein-like surface antigen